MGPRTPKLIGRRREQATLERLVTDVRRGQSGVLVVHGEPGVGKSALVDQVVSSAPDVEVMRAIGVESETEMAFGALHQLCGPVLDRIDRLPGPQRDALATVFGNIEGEPPDRFLVGLGVLTLLSGLGAERPLLCVVDDTHWLDQASAQTLTFVARRLHADPVGLVFITREPPSLLDGLPQLPIVGLDDDDARALLDAQNPFVLVDRDIRERIIREARGNPLALLELPRGRSVPEGAGGPATRRHASVSAQIEDGFQRRIEALPADARCLMLVAAAEPVGDPTVVLRACRALGIPPEAGATVAAHQLLEVGAAVRFRHPLVRSAAYRSASLDDRSRAHRALADATDGTRDPDRRAWHLAEAALAPDEAVAGDLERSAERAKARGGYAAAGAFMERAAALSEHTAPRARRALASAQAKHRAGAYAAASDLLAAAEPGLVDEADLTQVELLRSEIAFAERRGKDAPLLLLRAARRLESLDARAARATYLDALLAAHFAGRLADGNLISDVAAAALGAVRPPHPPTAVDLLLDGIASALTDSYAAAVPTLERAVRAFRDMTSSSPEEQRWLKTAANIAMHLWDDESYEALSARQVEVARRHGLLAVMPTALSLRVVAQASAGEFRAAEHLMRELRVLAEAMNVHVPMYGPAILAGWQGREIAADQANATMLAEATERGEGAGLAYADYAHALLCNGLGRYQEALDAAARIDGLERDGFVIYTSGLTELVEAAVRSGAGERAHAAFEQLAETTAATRTDWGAGVEARSRALVSEDDAEDLYKESIELLARTRLRPQLARSHLLYGEWLRRQNRRIDAREELRVAYESLSSMGAEAFAERARRELVATGETVRKRTVDTIVDLTPQEAQIAHLAIEGGTNPEIGAQLFLSARTVEWHLRKVFIKLGIASRKDLRTALEQLDTPAAAPS